MQQRAALILSIYAPDSGAKAILKAPDGVRGEFGTSLVRQLNRFTLGSYDIPQSFTGDARDLCIPPPFILVSAVSSKTLSGPGVPTARWTYRYSGYNGGAVPFDIWTDVTAPDGTRRRMHYIRTENTLQKEETFNASGALVQTVHPQYAYDVRPDEFELTTVSHAERQFSPCRAEGQIATPDLVALGPGPEVLNASPVPAFPSGAKLRSQSIVREGETYTTHYQYGAYNAPTRIERSSTLQSGARVTETTYQHDTAKWILDLPTSVRHAGRLFDTYQYDAKGQPVSHNRFGAAHLTMSYHPFGRVQRVTDALSRTVRFEDYYRGIARRLVRPDNKTLLRTVDVFGRVTSATDANGNRTSYAYNLQGWLTRIDPPGQFGDHQYFLFRCWHRCDAPDGDNRHTVKHHLL